jgi:hypothetical protein
VLTDSFSQPLLLPILDDFENLKNAKKMCQILSCTTRLQVREYRTNLQYKFSMLKTTGVIFCHVYERPHGELMVEQNKSPTHFPLCPSLIKREIFLSAMHID